MKFRREIKHTRENDVYGKIMPISLLVLPKTKVCIFNYVFITSSRMYAFVSVAVCGGV